MLYSVNRKGEIMKKRVIIFGATGHIGAYVTDELNKSLNKTEYEIIAVGRKNTDFFEKSGIKYIRLDITTGDLDKELGSDNIYAVINLIGVLPANSSEFDVFSYIDVNIKGSVKICEFARKHHVDRILYTQTWAEQAGFWGKETVLSPKLPRNLIFTGDHAFYAITKATVSDTLEFYKQEYGIKSFIFRLPNVYMYAPQKTYYSDYKEKQIAYRYMIERAIQGQDIELWGNPNAFKDILYVKDLCEIIKRAVVSEKNGGVYNAGTGIKTTLKEQIEGIIDVFAPAGHRPQIIERPEKSSFVSFVMDIDNIKSDLGYEPRYTYKKYLEDYKQEREKKRFDKLWK